MLLCFRLLINSCAFELQTVDLSSLPLPGVPEDLGDVRGANARSRRLVIKDGVHLFDPQAPHHSVLAREGIDSTSEGKPTHRIETTSALVRQTGTLQPAHEASLA